MPVMLGENGDIVSILDKIFGFERRIRKLRKTWDRRREKTLKKDEPIKSMCLEKLDRTEEKLRMLEERVMNRGERRRCRWFRKRRRKWGRFRNRKR